MILIGAGFGRLTEDGEDGILRCPHGGFRLGRVVVIAQQVQRAMHRQQAQLRSERVGELRRLAFRIGEGDEDVAQIAAHLLCQFGGRANAGPLSPASSPAS